MTDLDLAAVKQAAEKATAGPWTTQRWSLGLTINGADGRSLLNAEDGSMPVVEATVDAEFIAGARTWVPALVAEVERLEAENRQLREAVEVWRVHWGDIHGGTIGNWHSGCTGCLRFIAALTGSDLRLPQPQEKTT